MYNSARRRDGQDAASSLCCHSKFRFVYSLLPSSRPISVGPDGCPGLLIQIQPKRVKGPGFFALITRHNNEEAFLLFIDDMETKRIYFLITTTNERLYIDLL